MQNIHTALVVEDHAIWRDLYKRTLERNNIKVLLATNLSEGEALYISHLDQIGLIVMDGCLDSDIPNSMDLIKKIREQFSGPMIAATSSEAYMSKLTDAGCDIEFHKSKGSFKETLKQILS